MPVTNLNGPNCQHGKFLECPKCLRALIESGIAILVQTLGSDYKKTFEIIEDRLLRKLHVLTHPEATLNADVDGDEIIRQFLN